MSQPESLGAHAGKPITPVVSQSQAGRQLNLIAALNEALREEMIRDEKVFVIGEGLQQGCIGYTATLVDEFGPERIMDSPLSETAIAGAAVGSAMAGYRPIADLMYADFMSIAMNEILIQAGRYRFKHGGKVTIPVVFVAMGGGGCRLGAEHSGIDTGWFMHAPGLKLVVPAVPYDAKGLLKTAIRDNSPVVFLIPTLCFEATGEVPEAEYTIPFGQADVKREGTDVTVVAVGLMVHHALAVADELKGEVSVEVIDPRTLAPLDIETIVESVKKTNRAVVVEEDIGCCGPAGEIGFQIMQKAFDYLDAPVQRVAPNLPMPAGVLEELVQPQPRDIRRAIESVMA
jgi:pyruvate/2-oxoglutarate/acetoin dehydrogenase E1 component